ncbi:MAG: response regulator [Oligoflexia bacterium]|nr:response regulator [Oligoflexia bacterium]
MGLKLGASDTILLIDDDPGVREVHRLWLTGHGYQVTLAENGAVALRLLQEPPLPSLILLDLEMPVMDGHAFLEKLGNLAPIPVIVLSSSADDVEIPAAAAILLKPCSPEALLRAIRRQLDAHSIEGQTP